jgi:acetyl esterase
VFLYYGFANKPITPETTRPERSHHPVFGLYLKERMDKVGVECVLRHREDYEGKDAATLMNQDQVQFFLKHFPK